MPELAPHEASDRSIRRGVDGPGDAVDEASMESFPASDAPAWWAGTTASTDDVPTNRAARSGRREQKRPRRR